MSSFTKPLPIMGREQFVRFAGAVGDFNPVHYDQEFARSVGMADVISQGPLTFALALDATVGEIGLESISGFSARVTAPVVPDTELTVSLDGEDVSVVSEKGQCLVGTLTRR